ncbi:hypothetical protein BGZ93_010964 [Podila epicladia]|nr:hypothetical protein BGZ92_011750 [Podila epicladia]KAG0098610.1 hypothetical protein BGZ93_010964 [Podila epicladia]
MPFLSLSSPRNRASLVVVLLLLELMTILWLRRSSSERAPSVFPSLSQEQEPPYLLHRVIHQKKSKFSNPEGHHERIEDHVEELKEKSGAKEDKPTTNEHGNGQISKPMDKTIPDQHHHHQSVPDTSEKIRKPDQIEPKPTIPMPTLPNKVVAPSVKLTEDNRPKANKKTRTRKAKNAKEKGKNNKPQKSILERKLGQLIPALDENGVIIEDHFISPRDSDGDGIPDYYVLLRPSTNRYMMDVGLFDEDAVVPPAPAVLSAVIIASHPTAIPIVDPVVLVSPMEVSPSPSALTPPPPPLPPPAPVV